MERVLFLHVSLNASVNSPGPGVLEVGGLLATNSSCLKDTRL